MDYEAREYFKQAFTHEELQNVLTRAGMKPSELVSTRSVPYRSENLGERNLSEEEWLERMIAEPRLVRRPILVTDDEVIVGFDRQRFERIARSLAGEDPGGNDEKETE